MNPIFEQGDGRGIGHGAGSFLTRLDEICKSHLENGRATSFAFILYDFNDEAFKQMLKDQAVFAQLDRLSGDELSLFYLHTGRKTLINKFNSSVSEVLGLLEKSSFPCVMFFKFIDGEVTNIQVMEIDGSNDHTRFHDLYTAVEDYISKPSVTNKDNKAVAILKSTTRLVYEEFIKQVVKVIIQ